MTALRLITRSPWLLIVLADLMLATGVAFWFWFRQSLAHPGRRDDTIVLSVTLGLAVLGVALAATAVWRTRRAEHRIDLLERQCRALEADRLLDQAWALIGGQLDSPLLDSPTDARESVDQAAKLLDQAKASAPDHPRTHRVRGQFMAHVRRNRPAGMVCLRRAVELDPNDAVTHLVVGDLQIRAGKLDAAEASLERAVELDRDLHQARERLDGLAEGD